MWTSSWSASAASACLRALVLGFVSLLVGGLVQVDAVDDEDGDSGVHGGNASDASSGD